MFVIPLPHLLGDTNNTRTKILSQNATFNNVDWFIVLYRALFVIWLLYLPNNFVIVNLF